MTTPLTKRVTTVEPASLGSFLLFAVVVIASFVLIGLTVIWVAVDRTDLTHISYSVEYEDVPEEETDGYAGSYGQPTATLSQPTSGVVGPVAVAAGILLVFVGAALGAMDGTRKTVVEESVQEEPAIAGDLPAVITSILDFAKSARMPVVAMVAGLLIAGGGLWLIWSGANAGAAIVEHIDEVVPITVTVE